MYQQYRKRLYRETKFRKKKRNHFWYMKEKDDHSLFCCGHFLIVQCSNAL